ncbi:hypothetical protein J8273_0036 [Carpediemonas membranifera]|uniref:Uncharacterized protein n=1 Tax=Carpediemonas membranifera TaxID=201153 RepID=A0A8J6B7N2_9EUKA|nr:hypothetical protein J8273_0036 [Carpediemonas membranifera]|eukprot:KAG9394829.1 hypothetical protein J8273_0036 [Carpediemonas membranifera]
MDLVSQLKQVDKALNSAYEQKVFLEALLEHCGVCERADSLRGTLKAAAELDYQLNEFKKATLAAIHANTADLVEAASRQNAVCALNQRTPFDADIPGNFVEGIHAAVTALICRLEHLGIAVPDRTVDAVEPNVTQDEAAALASLAAKAGLVDPALVPLVHTLSRRVSRAARAFDGTSPSPRTLDIEGDLPDTLYTLMPGTIWGILMHAGADPGLDSRTVGDRILPFLCRKTFRTFAVANRPGQRHTKGGASMRATWFNGKLFTHGDNISGEAGTGTLSSNKRWSLVRVPPVVHFHTAEYGRSSFAVTPKGLFVFGQNLTGELGLDAREIRTPTLVPFSSAPAVSEYEQSLGPWRKSRLVQTIAAHCRRTIIATPVGLVTAGDNRFTRSVFGALGVCQDVAHVRRFTPLTAIPARDVTRIDLTSGHTAIFARDRCYVLGANHSGCFGLGHANPVDVLTPLTLDWAGGERQATLLDVDRPDDLVFRENAVFYNNGGRIYMAGKDFNFNRDEGHLGLFSEIAQSFTMPIVKFSVTSQMYVAQTANGRWWALDTPRVGLASFDSRNLRQMIGWRQIKVPPTPFELFDASSVSRVLARTADGLYECGGKNAVASIAAVGTKRPIWDVICLRGDGEDT